MDNSSRTLIASITDTVCSLLSLHTLSKPVQDTMTGLLLAGTGSAPSAQSTEGRGGLRASKAGEGAEGEEESLGEGGRNFYMVRPQTEEEEIQRVFDTFVARSDIAVILINQHVCFPSVHSLIVFLLALLWPLFVHSPLKRRPHLLGVCHEVSPTTVHYLSMHGLRMSTNQPTHPPRSQTGFDQA